jgi:CheY-like chemotaxis protein
MAKLLLIDDDSGFRRSISAALEKRGYEVIEAGSGAEGIRLARDQAPDLILCDVNMGGVSGHLTLYALRRDPAIARIPFLLMSGIAFSGEELPGTGRRADGFLGKPFTTEKLLTTIERCLTQAAESAVADEPTADSPRELLEEILEALRQIGNTDPQSAPEEIRRLASHAQESAMRLKRMIDAQ